MACGSAKPPIIECLPLLVTQLDLIIFSTRSLHGILRPLRQPRIVTDILVGPSFFGRRKYSSKLFPVRAIMTLEIVAYMAFYFYIFLLRLEMDTISIKHATKKELTIPAVGALISIGVVSCYFYLTALLLPLPTDPSGCLFWGLTLTVIGFPVFAWLLKKLKPLHTETGRMALSTSMMNDMLCPK